MKYNKSRQFRENCRLVPENKAMKQKNAITPFIGLMALCPAFRAKNNKKVPFAKSK